MDYKTLEISTDDGPEKFEYARWHILNYILRNGEIVVRSPLQEGRMRPQVQEVEFGTVTFDRGFYSFHVDPRTSGNVRTLRIVVGSNDDGDLIGRVRELTVRSDLTVKTVK